MYRTWRTSVNLFRYIESEQFCGQKDSWFWRHEDQRYPLGVTSTGEACPRYLKASGSKNFVTDVRVTQDGP